MEKRWKETAIVLAVLLFTLAPSLAIVDVQSRVADLAGNHSTGSFLPTAWHQCRWRAECCRAWYSIDLNFLPQLFVVIIVVMVKNQHHKCHHHYRDYDHNHYHHHSPQTSSITTILIITTTPTPQYRRCRQRRYLHHHHHHQSQHHCRLLTHSTLPIVILVIYQIALSPQRHVIWSIF